MIRRNAAANFIGQAWSSAMAIVFVPAYIAILGMEAYGLIGFFTALQVWLTVLDAGMTPALARETARLNAGTIPREEYENILRSIEILLLAIGACAAAFLAFGAEWIAANWLNLSEISLRDAGVSVVIMGGFIGLRFLEAAYRSALLGGGWHVAYNFYAVSVSTLRNGGVVLVLLVQPSILAFFTWQLAISILGIFAARRILRSRLGPNQSPPRFSRHALRRVRGFAGGMLFITVLALALSQMDKIVLAKVLPLSSFGYYAFSWSVTLALLTLVLPIVNATYPAFVAAHETRNEARLEGLLSATSRLVSLAVFPAAFTLAFWGHEAVLAWSNNPDLAVGTAPLILPLALAFALNAVFQTIYNLQLARGQVRLIILIYCTAIMAYVPALLVGAPIYGAKAAAYLWVALNIFYLCVSAPLVLRQMARPTLTRWLFRENLLPAGAALIVPLVVRWAMPVQFDRWTAAGLVVLVGLGSFASTVIMVPEARMSFRRLVTFRQEGALATASRIDAEGP